MRTVHSKLRSAHPRRRGSALALALITVAVVASAGAAYLQFTTATGRRQSSAVDTTHAFYMAEAGLAEAFHAVRIGRSGQIGSLAQPTRFGDGLVWVDAEAVANDQIRLTSTGMAGTGRATLGYTLQPKELTLGVFSVEELIIENVLLIDGYNSEEGTYQDQIPTDGLLDESTPEAIQTALSQNCTCGVTVGCHLGYHNWCTGNHDHTRLFGSPEAPGYQQNFDRRNLGADSFIAYWQELVNEMYEEAVLAALASGSEELPPRPAIGQTTGADGLLGSNANILFDLPVGTFAEVYGDVVPGHGGEISTANQVVISGDQMSRPSTVNLPEVEVPVVVMGPGILHEGLLPYVISTNNVGFESLTIAPDAELVIEGPATVVIGQLTLEAGATLTLDTRAGNVSLFVTGGMDLKPGSATVTTSQQTKDLTIQVAPIASSETGAPVKLDSASQFYGTLYAPETEVYLGSDFEYFGGLIARKLSFGPGARMHVDRAGTSGSALPKIVAWQIMEMPEQIKGLGGNPFQILGVDRNALLDMSEGNDLTQVSLNITYINAAGASVSYSGSEAAFDWTEVASVTSIERNADRPIAPPDDIPEVPADVDAARTPPVRPSISVLVELTQLAGSLSGQDARVVSLLQNLAPMTPEEWTALAPVSALLSAIDRQAVIDADIAAGGTGGL